MRSRVFILAAAIVLGLIAAFAAGRYLDGARRQVEAGTQPVEVLVAAKSIEPGVNAEEALKDGSIVKKKVARQYVADEAMSSFSTIDGQVSAVRLSVGEQVTQGDFRYASDAGASYSVPEGLLAVSVKDDPVRGVSRMVKPGDSVAVLATFEPDSGDLGTAITKIVLRRARVLAVDQSLTAVEQTGADSADTGNGALLGAQDAGDTSTLEVATVTLALTPEEAERLVFADDEGRLRLALIGKTDETSAATVGARYQDVMR